MQKYIIFLFSIIFITSLNSCSDDHSTEPQHDHYEAYGVNVYKNSNLFMKIFNTVLQPGLANEIIALHADESVIYNVIFLDEDGDELPLPDDDDISLGFLISDLQIAEIEIIDVVEYKFKIKTLKEGSTDVEIRLLHNDHPDFKTPKIPLKVQ